MSKVIYRAIDEQKPTIINSKGCWLFPPQGGSLLDMSGSACFSSLGYSNIEVIEAITDQLNVIPYAFSGYWATETAERAAELIAASFDKANPGWFGKCIFLQTGGEAVDLACKLAAQYHLEGGKHKFDILTRDYSFHGTALLPFSLSGEYPRYRLIEEYHKALLEYFIWHIPHPYNNTEALKITKEQYNAREYNGAMIIEPVSGPPLGTYVETKEYMQGLRNICDEQDMLLIYDEVLCGAGRCGYMSTAEMYGVWPDITILGKGISAGYQPVSVICLSEKVVDRIRKGSGRLMFGTTYSSHTAGCAAVEATINYINKHELLRNIRGPLSYSYKEMLKETLEDIPCIKEIRGTGFLWGVEFHNPETGESFNPELEFYAKARNAVMECGAVVYAKGGTVCGKGDFMTIAPPFEIMPNEFNQGLSMIRKGIELAYERMMNGHH